MPQVFLPHQSPASQVQQHPPDQVSHDSSLHLYTLSPPLPPLLQRQRNLHRPTSNGRNPLPNDTNIRHDTIMRSDISKLAVPAISTAPSLFLSVPTHFNDRLGSLQWYKLFVFAIANLDRLLLLPSTSRGEPVARKSFASPRVMILSHNVTVWCSCVTSSTYEAVRYTNSCFVLYAVRMGVRSVLRSNLRDAMSSTGL